MNLSRYDRQVRIHGWSQENLLRATVTVIGAGALGNETIKNLALLGVGQMLIVDFDRVEISNLSRTVLFREQDAGQPKARVAAERAREINPEIKVRYICGNAFHDVGLGLYRHSELVIGCLDNIAARSQVGISCSLTGVPYLDGGMWGLGGEVRWFLPGDGPCFECTLTAGDREQAIQRRSCTGFKLEDSAFAQPAVPTTINTAAIIGGLLSQEAARILCGWDVAGGEAIVFNGLSRKMHIARLTRDPNCAYHAPYQEVVELDHGPESLTVSSLLARARNDLGGTPILELGRDFLLSFRCQRCDNIESVNQLFATVPESRATCPECGSARAAEWISRLDETSPLCERKLAELGVPAAEILAVRSGERVRMYELNVQS